MGHKVAVAKKSRELSTVRIEAFSDGVFAIVATLLVIDLKLPQGWLSASSGLHSSDSLFHAIASIWPQVVSYALSFLTITIWWITHHHLFHVIQRTDRTLLWLNSLFLMFLVLIPFPTAILGSAPEDPVAVAFYGVVMMPIGIMMSSLRWYSSLKAELCDPQVPRALYKKALKKGLSSPLLYGTAAVLGYLVPFAGVFAYLLIAVFYMLPSSFDRAATEG